VKSTFCSAARVTIIATIVAAVAWAQAWPEGTRRNCRANRGRDAVGTPPYYHDGRQRAICSATPARVAPGSIE